jgi:hypothetical protein
MLCTLVDSMLCPVRLLCIHIFCCCGIPFPSMPLFTCPLPSSYTFLCHSCATSYIPALCALFTHGLRVAFLYSHTCNSCLLVYMYTLFLLPLDLSSPYIGSSVSAMAAVLLTFWLPLSFTLWFLFVCICLLLH